MKPIYLVSQQTHEKIEQLIEQIRKGDITPKERNEIILSLFKAETARAMLSDDQ